MFCYAFNPGVKNYILLVFETKDHRETSLTDAEYINPKTKLLLTPD